MGISNTSGARRDEGLTGLCVWGVTGQHKCWLRHSAIAAHCAMGQSWRRRGASLSKPCKRECLGVAVAGELCYTALVNLSGQPKM